MLKTIILNRKRTTNNNILFLNYLYVATMKSMYFLVVLLMLSMAINAIPIDENAPNAQDLEVPDLK